MDGRHSIVESLAHLVQQAISRAGLQLISLAALSVSLPPNIASQIQQANEEQIKAQTEQVRLQRAARVTVMVVGTSSLCGQRTRDIPCRNHPALPTRGSQALVRSLTDASQPLL